MQRSQLKKGSHRSMQALVIQWEAYCDDSTVRRYYTLLRKLGLFSLTVFAKNSGVY